MRAAQACTIDRTLRAIADICRRFGVPGSSDADFLVEFVPSNGLPFLRRFFGLEAALSQLPGRRIDLVEPGTVRNPYVRASIDRAREVVYGA